MSLCSPAIHPNWQVYFIGYAHSKRKKRYTKFVVLDTKTIDPLYGVETMEVPKFEAFPKNQEAIILLVFWEKPCYLNSPLSQ